MKHIIPHAEQDKLNNILDMMNHPDYVDRDRLLTLFDKLNLVFWQSSEPNISQCSFCTDKTEFFNKHINMFACSSCMQDLENKEIDIFYPDDHALSNKLRLMICNWIDMNHHCYCNSAEYFADYKMNYNICHICHNDIEDNPDDDVAIANNIKAVAHGGCVGIVGFQNCYSKEDYDAIIEDLDIDKYIDILDKIPLYQPPMSNNDKEILNNIMADEEFLNNINYGESFVLP